MGKYFGKTLGPKKSLSLALLNTYTDWGQKQGLSDSIYRTARLSRVYSPEFKNMNYS